MPNKVLTITMNPAVDVNSEADKVITNQKVRCVKPDYDPGGGGINVARVITRLGVQAKAFYLAGGITGDYLTYLMKEEKVPHEVVTINGMTRENTSIIDNKTGEQYRFVFPGPEIQESEWEESLKWIEENIAQYDIVVGSGSLPPGVPTDFYSKIAELALGKDKMYVLDTSGETMVEGIKNGATFIKPNQEEFEELRKRTGSGTNDELIQKLFDQGIENIIYTRGKEKTLLINKRGRKEFVPPEIEVNSSIGAGDSFIGGLVAGLMKGMQSPKAVCYGISAAASTLKSAGTDLCELNDVEKIHTQLCGS